MIGALVGLAVVVGPFVLVIWLANRDRSRGRPWGDQGSQNNIMVGAEFEMPRILPVEPVAGLTVNCAPVDDTSHEQVLARDDMKRPTIGPCESLP